MKAIIKNVSRVLHFALSSFIAELEAPKKKVFQSKTRGIPFCLPKKSLPFEVFYLFLQSSLDSHTSSLSANVQYELN